MLYCAEHIFIYLLEYVAQHMCLVRVSSASAAVMSLLIAQVHLSLEFGKVDMAVYYIPSAGLQVLANVGSVSMSQRLLLLLCHSFTGFCTYLCMLG